MSVRGTTFSVAYDNTKMETTVEVIEGSVLVTANGKEQMLEQGDVITIGADIENVQGMSVDGLGGNGSDQLPVNIYSEDFKEPVFMLTRYYQNVPDYANASAESLEITINCADSSYSFEFSKVCIDWNYMYSPGSVDGSYQVYYPLDYIDEDGMQYSILGITFTFY